MPSLNTYPLALPDDDVFALAYKAGDTTDSPEGSTVRVSMQGMKPTVVLHATDGVVNAIILQNKLTAVEPIVVPFGRAPVTGELSYPHNTSVNGYGCMSILVFDNTNGFVPADLIDGAVSCHFSNFTIDCGWVPAWGADPATGDLTGLYVLSDIDDTATNTLNSLANFGDNYSRIHNVHITNVRGTGLRIEGRGEILVTHCNIVRCLTRGIDDTAFDMWFLFNSISVCGQECMFVGRAGATTGEESGASGNIRAVGNKYWFNGMSSHTRPSAAVMIDSPAHSVSHWSNESIQDTAGKAIHFNGDGIVWDGMIDAPARLFEWLGFGMVHQSGTKIVDVDDVRQSTIKITMTDRLFDTGVRADLNQRPLDIGIGATLNNITLNLVTATGKAPWWDTTREVTVHASNQNPNIVRDNMGGYLYRYGNKSITSASRDLANDDFKGEKIVFVDAAAVLTIPDTVSMTEPLMVISKTAGEVSFVAGANVTINAKDDNLVMDGIYSSVLIVPEGNDVYTLGYVSSAGVTGFTALPAPGSDSLPYFRQSTGEMEYLPTLSGLRLNDTTLSVTREITFCLFDATDPVVVGDTAGGHVYAIPSEWAGMDLIEVATWSAVAGTGTGTTDVQIRNLTDVTDMLSTVASINSTQLHSSTATVAAEIDPLTDDVANADLLAMSVTAIPAGDAPLGLWVYMKFGLAA